MDCDTFTTRWKNQYIDIRNQFLYSENVELQTKLIITDFLQHLHPEIIQPFWISRELPFFSPSNNWKVTDLFVEIETT